MNFKRFSNESDWLEFRKHGLGASEVSSILGQSRFGSTWSVWQSKVDQTDSNYVENDMMAWGHRHEPAIADKFRETVCKENGWQIENPGDYAVSVAEDPPWLFSTLDRYVTKGGVYVGPLELKCAWYAAAREWEERVPLGYRCQLQIQMYCTGAQEGFYAVLLNGYDWRYYHEKRNDRFLQSTLRRLREFWKHVENRVPPPTDFTDATAKAISQHYSDPRENSINFPVEFDNIHSQRESLLAKQDEIKRQLTSCNNAFKEKLGNSTVGVLSDGRTAYTWKPNKKGVRSLRTTTLSE